MHQVIYKPIGIIHSAFKDKESTPIQGIYDPESIGEIEVFPQYLDGLKDVAGFSHLILVYHFHLAEGFSLITTPFLDNAGKGIFSIRHFNRPNSIGLSVVRLEKVEGRILTIGEVDIIDGTPLLDIKPYIPEFDARVGKNVRKGWFERAANEMEYKLKKGRQKRLEDC